MTAPTLDQLLDRARGVEVRPGAGAGLVGQLVRGEVAAPAGPWWRWWLAPALVGAMAAGALLVWLGPRQAAPARVPTWQLGERVTVAPSPGAAYLVRSVDDAQVDVEVIRGAITARLWPGRTSQRLVLRAGELRAEATGTIYTLAVDGAAARVDVHEGRVAVSTGGEQRWLDGGASWSSGPPLSAPSTTVTAAILFAPPPALAPSSPDRDVTAGLVPQAPLADAGAPEPAPSPDAAPAADAGLAVAASPPGSSAPPDAATSPATAKDRFRRARLLRSQGKPRDARAALALLVRDGDPIWAPLAQVELVRVELEALASPEQAAAAADEFLRRWPAHALAADVRDLRCRALTQLGRRADC